jgi:acyl-CoA hydrolase
MQQRLLKLRFLAEPTDVNYGGKVHGGAVMKWIDQAGYACASVWSGEYCVTAYVGGIRFLAPIHIGNIVELTSQVIYTGNTSMHIAIDVHARDPRKGKRVRTTHCVIVMVAMEDGKPKSIPKWTPTKQEDVEMEQYALALMEKRKDIESEMHPYFIRNND